MKLVAFVFITLLLGSTSFANSNNVFSNFSSKNTSQSTVKLNLNSSYKEIILPKLNNPNLTDPVKNWDNAHVGNNFTVTQKQAIALAHGLQGAGEWRQWLPKTQIPRSATLVSLGYSDKYLYIKAICTQRQMARLLKIPSSYNRDGAAWGHENIDITFAKDRYNDICYKIIIDVNGKIYDSKIIKSTNKSVLSWNPKYFHKTFRNKDSWSVILALPISEWGIKTTNGSYIDCNIGRVELLAKEHSTLGPVEAAFAEPENMCRLWFSKKIELPTIEAIEYSTPIIGTNKVKILVANKSKKLFNGQVLLDKQSIKVSLKPNSKKFVTFNYPITKSGNWTPQITLSTNSNQQLFSTKLKETVKDQLMLKLNSKEFIFGNNPINGQIEVNSPIKNAQLELSLGKIKKVITAANLVNFTITPPVDAEEKTILQVKLLSGEKVISHVKETISITKDPFDE